MSHGQSILRCTTTVAAVAAVVAAAAAAAAAAAPAAAAAAAEVVNLGSCQVSRAEAAVLAVVGNEMSNMGGRWVAQGYG